MHSYDYTVLGGNGFIGSHLVSYYSNAKVFVPERKGVKDYLLELKGKCLGHVFYCIGMTADFRSQPFATMDANLLLLRYILEECDFTRLCYLSSTRVYAGGDSAEESSILKFRPEDPDHSYNLTKAMGENLTLNSGRNTKVVRLSNVYGREMKVHNFLGSVLLDAALSSKVLFRSAPNSVKDFIAIEDVVRYLDVIIMRGKQRIYNVASGVNTSNFMLSEILKTCDVEINFADASPLVLYPQINIRRLTEEFGQVKHHILVDLPNLLQHQKKLHSKS